jgi:hypothetical protein
MAKDKSPIPGLQLSHEMLRLIAETGEFKGRWQALQTLSPERLLAEALPLLSVTILKLLGRTRTADDCGVGALDGSQSEYAQSAVAGIDAGGEDCEAGAGGQRGMH